MSDSINNGGPAFPVTLDHRGCVGAYGMSLRDWFAGQALAGWCAASPTVRKEPLNMTAEHAESIATGCYRYADAMLEARKLNTTSK